MLMLTSDIVAPLAVTVLTRSHINAKQRRLQLPGITDRVDLSRYERAEMLILLERTRDQRGASFEVAKEPRGEFSYLAVAVVAVVVVAGIPPR